MAVRALIGSATLGAMVLASSISRADCIVRMEGATAPWREAAHTLEAATQSAPSDCAVIDIRADRHGAFVELQTTDGREAIRHIVAPNELGPLVRALLTSVPAPPPAMVAGPAPEPPAAAPAVAAATDPFTDPLVDRAPEPARSSPTSASNGIELFGGLGAGVKMQADDRPGAIGRVHGGVSFGAWQVGGFGRWEFAHHEAPARNTSVSAAGGGATLGRRQPLGPTTIVFGVSFGLFSVAARTAGGTDGATVAKNSVLDPRGGLYAGVVMPALGGFRSRVQLESEMALLDRDTGFPNIPDWGMALTLGIDFGTAK